MVQCKFKPILDSLTTQTRCVHLNQCHVIKNDRGDQPKNMCIYAESMDTGTSVVKAWGAGAGWREAKGGENGGHL